MNDFDFDKHYNSTRRFILSVWIIGLVVGLSLLAGLVYVGCHFLAKVW
jgi:hypothetical protein